VARTALCVAFIVAMMPAVRANRSDVAQNQFPGTVKVQLYCDGTQRPIRTALTTVGATLEEAGVKLGPADLVFPKRDRRVVNGMAIRVVRVANKVVVKKWPVGFMVIRRPTRLMSPGRVRVLQRGEPGQITKTFSVVYYNGRSAGSKLLKQEMTVKPKDTVVLVGDVRLAYRGSYVSRRRLLMHASAYDPGPRSCGSSADGYTATGMKAGYGVVAVDPKYIPLGTRLFIEGYGFAVAGDVGRAIKGHRIDLGFDTYRAAKQFGRRRVQVHILKS